MTFEFEMFQFLLQRNKNVTEGDTVDPYKALQFFSVSIA